MHDRLKVFRYERSLDSQSQGYFTDDELCYFVNIALRTVRIEAQMKTAED
jgi:hypothetical protein